MLARRPPAHRPWIRFDQFARRAGERQVREDAVAFAAWLAGQGLSLQEAAACLGIRPRTLARWRHWWLRIRHSVVLRGRKPVVVPETVDLQIKTQLEVLGPQVGLVTLQTLFPGVPRRYLMHLQHRHRVLWRRSNRIEIERLDWTAPGSVWAADYTWSPVPIDGCYRYLLVVRDLASHMQLLALPCEHADSTATAMALEYLFRTLGAPLVLKTDNGSHFRGEGLMELMDRFGVTILLSPPLTPRYNGAVEAGQGGLKTRSFWQAVAHGRFGEWTSDDVEAARTHANLYLRPWGLRAGSPQDRWDARRPVLPAQRQTLQARVRFHHQQLLEHMPAPWEHLDANERASVVRRSIRQALEELGYLVVTKQRISPPIKSPLRLKIR